MKTEVLMSSETRDRMRSMLKEQFSSIDVEKSNTYGGLPVRIVNSGLPHYCDDHKLHDDRCAICSRQVL